MTKSAHTTDIDYYSIKIEGEQKKSEANIGKNKSFKMFWSKICACANCMKLSVNNRC